MSKQKNNWITLIAIAMTALCLSPAHSQSHNWNINARERAENANSRALTILNKGPAVKGWIDLALAALIQATSADPTDPVPFTTLGLALDLKQRYSEALDALAKSYRLEPKSTETTLSIGITHYLGHSYRKAEDALTNLLRQNPNFCAAHIDLGYVYMRMGDFTKAKQQFKQAIVCNPNCQPAYQGMALVDYLGGDLESAYAEAQHAETLQAYAPVTYLLAEVSFLRGDEGLMRASLKRLAKYKQPLEQRPMTQIGFSAQHDFHWDPFLADDFDRGAFINARALDLPLLDKKRASLAASGKIDAVLERAEQALATAPKDFYLLRQVGLLNLAAGNYVDAVKQFNEVITICPNSHIDFLYLGRALALSGKKAEAAQCIREYQNHFPGQQLASIFSDIAQASAPPPTTPQPPQQQMPPPSDTGF